MNDKEILHYSPAPFFQSIICVDTMKVFGYEVLGRRISHNGNISSLGPFFHDPNISAAEKVQVDRLIRDRAMKMYQNTIDQKHLLFINIQPEWIKSYLKNSDELPTINLLKKYGIPAEKIVIEIAESQFWDDMNVLVELVAAYRDAGCMIAIDDVGTGFSNLDRIVHISPDFLKIDAGLVQGCIEKEAAYSIMESLGIFAQRMGMGIILEGVETRDQFIAGLETGARYYQGYLFSHPLPTINNNIHINKLIKNDLNEHFSREMNRIRYQLDMTRELNEVLEGMLLQGNWHLVPLDEMLGKLCIIAPDNWLRLYICNELGFQQTDNHVRLTDYTWVQKPEYRNRYWGWRPYFIPSMLESRIKGEGVLSEQYSDVDTGEITHTFCYPLGKDSFLFVDCAK